MAILNLRKATTAFALLLFGAAFAVYATAIFRQPLIGDGRVYVAGVHALYENFWHPQHESLALGGDESFAFTPYLRAVAALGMAFDLTGYRAIQLGGLLNLCAYFAGMLFFFRSLLGPFKGTVGATAFLVVSLLLRDENAYWSSEMSFRSLCAVAAYPSSCAWACALWMFGHAERYLTDHRRHRLVVIALALWVSVLSHPLTASWAFGIVGMRGVTAVLGAPREARRRALHDLAALTGALVTGFVASLFWPNASFLNPAITTARAGDPSGGHPFRMMATAYAVAAVAAVHFDRRRQHGALLGGFVATLAVFALSEAAGLSYGSRYVYFMAFFAHVACALLVVDGLRAGVVAPALPGRLLGAFVALAVTALAVTSPEVRGGPLVAGPVPNPVEMLPRPPAEQRFYAQLDPVRAHLSEGDIVLCPDEKVSSILFAVTGARAVRASYTPHLRDAREREVGTRDFFAVTTSREQRAAIARRFGATLVMLRVRDMRDGVGDAIARDLGPPVVVDAHLRLWTTARLLAP